jgi:hypothetical protein
VIEGLMMIVVAGLIMMIVIGELIMLVIGGFVMMRVIDEDTCDWRNDDDTCVCV